MGNVLKLETIGDEPTMRNPNSNRNYYRSLLLGALIASGSIFAFNKGNETSETSLSQSQSLDKIISTQSVSPNHSKPCLEVLNKNNIPECLEYSILDRGKVVKMGEDIILYTKTHLNPQSSSYVFTSETSDNESLVNFYNNLVQYGSTNNLPEIKKIGYLGLDKLN